MRLVIFTFSFILALAAGVLASCAADSPRNQLSETNDKSGYEPPSIHHGEQRIGFDGMIEDIDGARAVLVGEVHDRYDHHLNQLRIIERLYERNPRLAIGMEQFQQPFQSWLDKYVAGDIDTDAMLLGTEYYKRWRLDYRLYEPILSWARARRVPVVALNLPAELTRKVATQGLKALSEEETARLPQLDRSDQGYRRRLREIYEKHPAGHDMNDFENFYTAQLLWDEGMAARAAKYLESHPDAIMVILAGEGHIEYGSGIPARLARRIEGNVVTVIHARGDNPDPARADYILDSKPVELPKRGLLGVMIDPAGEDARVIDMSADSPAKAAGVQNGDVITAVDGAPVESFADLKVRMWDKLPGDAVSITVRRSPDEEFQLAVTLR